jgi:hypothetical protein
LSKPCPSFFHAQEEGQPFDRLRANGVGIANANLFLVTPAKAGVSLGRALRVPPEMPAFAGMTMGTAGLHPSQ